MAMRGMRGATTATANTAEEIIEATQELIVGADPPQRVGFRGYRQCLLDDDARPHRRVPAFAARQVGWADVPQMCAHEMDVPGN